MFLFSRDTDTREKSSSVINKASAPRKERSEEQCGCANIDMMHWPWKEKKVMSAVKNKDNLIKIQQLKSAKLLPADVWYLHFWNAWSILCHESGVNKVLYGSGSVVKQMFLIPFFFPIRRSRWRRWLAGLWCRPISVLCNLNEDLWATGEGGSLHTQ